MGKNKKHQRVADKKLLVVASLSSEEVSAIKAELVSIVEQYEALAMQFKVVSNVLMIAYKSNKKKSITSSSVLSKSNRVADLVTQELTQYHAEFGIGVHTSKPGELASIRASEQKFASTNDPGLAVAYSSRTDLSGSASFRQVHQQVDSVIAELEIIKNKLKGGYLNEFAILYIKFMILKSKCVYWGPNPALALEHMWKVCNVLNPALVQGQLKYANDVVMQHEVGWLIEKLESHRLFYPLDAESDANLRRIIVEGCLFADKCVNAALKLNLYSLALIRFDDSNRLVLHYPNGINVTDLHHHYDVTRKHFFDLIERKQVDAQAVLEFINASVVTFIIRNLASKNSFYWKHRGLPALSVMLSMNSLVSDAEFRAHLETTKKQRLEYLETGIRLLSQTHLSIMFQDAAICTALQEMLVAHRASLHTYVIGVYQAFLNKRNKDDALSADIKLEIIQFERLSNMLIDCFQFLVTFDAQATLVTTDPQPYIALNKKEKEIIVFREQEFLRQEKEAKDNANAVLKWKEQGKECEGQRNKLLEKRRTKKKSFYKEKKDKKSVSSNEPSEKINAEKAVSMIDSFIAKAVTYIQERQFAQASTAYEVAKKIATHAGDAYGRLCALDGLIYVAGAELLQHLDYYNAILSSRLNNKRVLPRNERESLFALLQQALIKFQNIKNLRAEYGEVVVNPETIAALDVQEGIAFGKRLIEGLLQLTENKVLQAQEAFAAFQRVTHQSFADLIFKRGLERWHKLGNTGAYDEKVIKRHGRDVLREAWRVKVAVYKEAHGDEAFSSEKIISEFTAERRLSRKMAPLMNELQSIPASIDVSCNQFINVNNVITYHESVFDAFINAGLTHGTLLLVGETVVKLLRKQLEPNAILPANSILVGNSSEVNLAKCHAQSQFFTKTSVCCNKRLQWIDICQTGVDDILNYRLRMIAANPLIQINKSPECMIEAVKHMCEGDKPVPNLEKAMREWVPDKHYPQKRKYVLAAARTQLTGLAVEERIKQVQILLDYGLMEKLFSITHKKAQRALWALEDKWLVNVSVAKFGLLAKTEIKLGAQDDIALNKRLIKHSST